MNDAHQAQIHQHQFHRRVADAFAQRIGRGVHLIRARGNRCQRIRDGQAAIVVAVPVHANFFADWA